jgi:predicted MFS family arabinose efflux permease
MELLRREEDPTSLDKAVCWGVRLNYALGMLIPPIACLCLDYGLISWRLLFTLVALLYLCHLFIIIQLPPFQKISPAYKKDNLLAKGWKLLTVKKEFANYLILYFLTGAGIVASQGMLPLYFKNELNLSYTELGLAFSFCKGLSFMLSSPIWNQLTKRISLLRLNCYAALFTSLYFLFLLFSSFAIELLFIAYLAYGTMQGGNELSWHLSGPAFSRNQESTLYSTLNLLVAGIRGALCPILGCIIYETAGFTPLFIAAIATTLSGVVFGFWIEQNNKLSQESL